MIMIRLITRLGPILSDTSEWFKREIFACDLLWTYLRPSELLSFRLCSPISAVEKLSRRAMVLGSIPRLILTIQSPSQTPLFQFCYKNIGVWKNRYSTVTLNLDRNCYLTLLFEDSLLIAIYIKKFFFNLFRKYNNVTSTPTTFSFYFINWVWECIVSARATSWCKWYLSNVMFLCYFYHN